MLAQGAAAGAEIYFAKQQQGQGPRGVPDTGAPGNLRWEPRAHPPQEPTCRSVVHRQNVETAGPTNQALVMTGPQHAAASGNLALLHGLYAVLGARRNQN